MIETFIRRHYVAVLIGIAIFAFATRVYRVQLPKEYIFDEVYHALTAKLIRRNDPRAYEWWHQAIEPNTAIDWLHPPLAKYTQALSMDIFGENSLGWRMSSVVFGTFVIVITALLADELFENKVIAVFAAGLAACDGLLLVQSRIAMNDIHVTFFILLTFLLYVHYRKKESQPAIAQLFLFLTGLSAGLASGSKWSGVFALITVWFFELLRVIAQRMVGKWHFSVAATVRTLIFLFAVPAFVYLLSYSHMFLQGKSLICEGNHVEQGKCYCNQDSSWWVNGLKTIAPGNSAYWESLEARGGCKRLISHFSELHRQIWWYQTHLQATHPYQSRPWQWFLDVRPVWFYVSYNDDTVANIYSQGNPFLFWIGDIAVLATIGALFIHDATLQKKKKGVQVSFLFLRNFWTRHAPFSKHERKFENVEDVFWSLFFLIVAYLMVWLPWEFSPRIMFFYHYTPAVPLLSIILAYWLARLLRLKKESLVIAALFLIAGTFVLFYPNWTGIPVPKTFADHVYFAIGSWR